MNVMSVLAKNTFFVKVAYLAKNGLGKSFWTHAGASSEGKQNTCPPGILFQAIKANKKTTY